MFQFGDAVQYRLVFNSEILMNPEIAETFKIDRKQKIVVLFELFFPGFGV